MIFMDIRTMPANEFIHLFGTAIVACLTAFVIMVGLATILEFVISRLATLRETRLEKLNRITKWP